MEKALKKSKIKLPSARVSAAWAAKTAMLSAIAFVLYAFGKFNLPMMFPSFLEIQFSELPALLAGFALGPVSGCVVIVVKCLLKLPLSSTMFVGELTDILLGICFVLPASLIYKFHKNKKGALLGMLAGMLLATGAAVLVNRFISIPFYLQMFFGGDWNILLGIVSPLYPSVTMDGFYFYYLLVGVVPFNLFRYLLVCLITFLLYKRLSFALHWEFKPHKECDELPNEFVAENLEDTERFARLVANTLHGGEILLLDGDLGAGKTTFTKSLAAALGVTDEVTSPTFTILNIYEGGRLPLYHMDMYRIENADDLYETGVEDYLAKDGVTVIEWNKLTDLSGKIISIAISPLSETSRKFVVKVESK